MNKKNLKGILLTIAGGLLGFGTYMVSNMQDSMAREQDCELIAQRVYEKMQKEEKRK